MKAYKNMDGYNFFIHGWVGKVECKVVVVKASVWHSQSISSPLLHPWVATERDGTIICAHCTWYPSCSYVGVSPDSVVECDYCGRGVLEVKFPYQRKVVRVSKMQVKTIASAWTMCVTVYLHHLHYIQITAIFTKYNYK